MSNPIQIAESILNNLQGADPLLTPENATALLSVSPKWLANAREGRKNLVGPPFIKLGNGRTAPVRYKLSSLVSWLNSFTEHTSTVMGKCSIFSSFKDFSAKARADEKWLFALNPRVNEAVDVIEALKDGDLPGYVRFVWLTREEFQQRRFLRHVVRMSPETYQKLLDIGAGNLSAGLANLLLIPPK